MIDALTGLRFFLVMAMVLGHFVQVSTSTPWILSLFKQHNMIVGAFFALSGFVLAIAHKYKISPNTWLFLKKRLTRIYKTYVCILVLFAPMFIYIDRASGSSLSEILWHALIVFTLTQAWNPHWGLLWNSPTWFLSAWIFANAFFPKFFSWVRDRSFRLILSCIALIFSILLVFRLAYSWKMGFWGLEEMNPHLNNLLFNTYRFNPLLNTLEFLSGTAVGVLFTRKTQAPKHSALYSDLIAVLLAAILVLRIFVPLNDLLSRTFYVPLFLVWIYYLSFQRGFLNSVLKAPIFVYLGNLSFSIYIIHGALGQLLYKRIVKAWTGWEAPSFLLYLVLVFLGSVLLYHRLEEKKGAPKA